MVSDDYLVERLCQMTGEEPRNSGIEWEESPEGYTATVNGVNLFLFRGLNIRLMFREGMMETVVYEPDTHISEVPFGKFMQSVTQIWGAYWPAPPNTSEKRAKEKLRRDINKLYHRAAKQQVLRQESQGDEGVRQQLFQKLLFREGERGEADDPI